MKYKIIIYIILYYILHYYLVHYSQHIAIPLKVISITDVRRIIPKHKRTVWAKCRTPVIWNPSNNARTQKHQTICPFSWKTPLCISFVWLEIYCFETIVWVHTPPSFVSHYFCDLVGIVGLRFPCAVYWRLWIIPQVQVEMNSTWHSGSGFLENH